MINWFMKFLKKKKPEPKQQQAAPEAAKAAAQQAACGITEFKKLFDNDDTFITRAFLCGKKQCCIAYINGMVNTEVINLHIVDPLMRAEPPAQGDLAQWILDSVISSDEVTLHTELGKMADNVILGDTILFMEGMQGALTINTKLWLLRAITEPESEKVLRGPREGFNESLIVNMTMMRRKLRTPDFKVSLRKIGTRSNTTYCICYLQELVNQEVLDELNRRLAKIDIDSVLSIEYIEEIIKDSPLSIFDTVGTTERPDVLASKLLEGRVAIMVDGGPTAMTVPFVFLEYFQAAEDYYTSFWTATIGRILRIAGFFFSIAVPAIYLALTTMHQEMVPTSLLLAINAARQQVPLPTVAELIVMILAFEILRESGERLPNFLGQSLSIVGGLVVGQAAVAARLVSAPIVIVVAFTGITGLMTPKLQGAYLIMRLGLVVITSIIGFFGLMIGLTAIFIHMLGIRSFGVQYMAGTLPSTMQDFKDSAIRVPWPFMIMRPRHISVKDSVRQAGKKV